MINRLNNQRGNIVLLTLCIMSLMIVMFLVLANFVKVFALKEGASSNAQQASIAATSVVYQEVEEAVEEYDDTLLGTIDGALEGDTLEKKIEKRKDHLLMTNSNLSGNEAKIQATDEVLSEELTESPLKDKLNEILLDHLTSGDITQAIKNEVEDVIRDNDGTLSNSIIYYMDDGQITVRTSSKYEALKFDETIPDDKRDINQTGTGPDIEFIHYLNGWSNQELTW